MTTWSVREVVRATGFTERTLQHYDNIGLLVPARTGEGVANNRKVYSDGDILRLRNIGVLKEYGFSLKEIGNLLEGSADDVAAAVEARALALRKEANRLRNSALFLRYVKATCEDFFEALAVGPETLDQLATIVRETPYYCQAMDRLQSYSPEELAELKEDLHPIIEEMLLLDDAEGMDGVLLWARHFGEWWARYVGEMEPTAFFHFWAVFEDSPVLAAEFDRIGGGGACAYAQMFGFFCWVRYMVEAMTPVLERVTEAVNNDVALASEAFMEMERALSALSDLDELCDEGWGQWVQEIETPDGETHEVAMDYTAEVAGFVILTLVVRVLNDEELVRQLEVEFTEPLVDGLEAIDRYVKALVGEGDSIPDGLGL